MYRPAIVLDSISGPESVGPILCLCPVRAVLTRDIRRVDSGEARVTEQQKALLQSTLSLAPARPRPCALLANRGTEKLIDGVLERIVLEVKESIGLPLQIDRVPRSFRMTAT
jgi:hypothetical protein